MHRNRILHRDIKGAKIKIIDYVVMLYQLLCYSSCLFFF